jgi:hypothetical protein
MINTWFFFVIVALLILSGALAFLYKREQMISESWKNLVDINDEKIESLQIELDKKNEINNTDTVTSIAPAYTSDGQVRCGCDGQPTASE